ncbi:hypothetical protein JYP51_15520 [Ponticoccus gilvus]|nr:hypothetical protein [Enemella evansiae]
MRYLICGVASLALMACEPSMPDSGAGVADRGQGVGFSDYDSYQAYHKEREARLNGTAPATTIAAPPAVSGGALGAADTVADSNARIAAAAANSGVAPLNASPSNAAPAIVENARGISGENDFDAVAAQRDIDDDARLIAENRAQYQVVAPEALPTREGSNRPNIVAFALQTTNPVGTALYKRGGFNAEAKYQRACASFASADLAQEEFLANGGPERDRQGMDPDGDGFACSWNPAPFRAVRGG